MRLRPPALLLVPALGLALAPAIAQPAGVEPGPDAADSPGSQTTAPPAPELEPVRVADPMLEPPAKAARRVRSWGDALRYVRDGSSSLRSARAQVLAAEGQSRQALSRVLPTLTGSAGIARHLLRGEGINFYTGQPSRLPDPATSWNAGVTLRVPLVDLRGWHDYRTSAQQIDVGSLQANETERLVSLGLARSIVAVVTSERLCEVTRINLRSALSTVEIYRRRLHFGTAGGVDLLRAEQDVHRARHQVIAADETLQKAREALGLALGRNEPFGVSPILRLDDLGRKLARSCRPMHDATERADVRMAAARRQIAERDADSVDYAFLPTLEANSTITYYSDTFTPNREHAVWTVGALLTWRLYDGGLRYGQGQTTSAQLTVTREAELEARRQAQVEIRQARRAVGVAQANLETERARHDTARRTAKLAQLAFLQGTGSSFDLVETQRSLREVEIDVTVAEYQLVNSQLSALLALADCAV